MNKKIIGILICTLLIATAVPSMATILTEKQNLNASDGTGNRPPTAPTISGFRLTIKDKTYTYTFVSTDPDNDKVEYFINWGDGTNSGWIGPYISGFPRYHSHSWTKLGTYLIKAIARDEHGLENEGPFGCLQVTVFAPFNWGALQVTMPHILY